MNGLNYKEQALAVLKQKGLRITKPRQLVVELLDKAAQALSAYEIKDLLDKAGNKVDTVSIYRILECLEDNHLIHRLLANGKVLKCQLAHEAHCTLHQKDHCHHLLICEQCCTIQEIHCPGIDELIQKVEQRSDFKISHHNMEFLGCCAQCTG